MDSIIGDALCPILISILFYGSLRFTVKEIAYPFIIRIVAQFGRFSFGYDSLGPFIQHDNPVGNGEYAGKFMSYNDHGGAQ